MSVLCQQSASATISLSIWSFLLVNKVNIFVALNYFPTKILTTLIKQKDIINCSKVIERTAVEFNQCLYPKKNLQLEGFFVILMITL